MMKENWVINIKDKKEMEKNWIDDKIDRRKIVIIREFVVLVLNKPIICL